MEFTQAALKLVSDNFGVATMQYHYSDCDCASCHDRHFPCQDADCAYCTTVRNIQWKYSNDYWNPRSFDLNDLLPYSVYESWADDKEFDQDDLIMVKCSNYWCKNRISKQFGYDHDGYCKEHYAEYKESQYDEYNDDYEDDDSDSDYEDRTFGDWDHKMGEILNPRDYSHTTECWIAPNGNLHYVPLYVNHSIGHYETAQLLGLGSTDGAERRGYIHVSTYYSSRNAFHYVPSNASESQIESSMLLCDAHGWEYPEFVQEWLDQNKDNDQDADDCIHCIEIAPMQNLSPSWLCMTRKERDLWYPNSGD